MVELYTLGHLPVFTFTVQDTIHKKIYSSLGYDLAAAWTCLYVLVCAKEGTLDLYSLGSDQTNHTAVDKMLRLMCLLRDIIHPATQSKQAPSAFSSLGLPHLSCGQAPSLREHRGKKISAQVLSDFIPVQFAHTNAYLERKKAKPSFVPLFVALEINGSQTRPLWPEMLRCNHLLTTGCCFTNVCFFVCLFPQTIFINHSEGQNNSTSNAFQVIIRTVLKDSIYFESLPSYCQFLSPTLNSGTVYQPTLIS